MDILRIVARWTGFPGAPGYSSFYFSVDGGLWDGGLLGDEAELVARAASERVTSAFTQMQRRLPPSVEIKTEPEADIINSDTGEILGSVPAGSWNAVDGSATGGFSGPSGAVVNWRTNDYRAGRRIRGRTFLVPLASSSYEADGTLTSEALSDLRSFGTEMRTGEGAQELGVWSRPTNGSGGVFATVTGSSVPDMAAVLRSRRD